MRLRFTTLLRSAASAATLLASFAGAQTVVPLPKLGVPSLAPVPDPVTPAASSFHDIHYGVSFKVPNGWNLTHKDGEWSTFRDDVPSAMRSSQMRALATIDFNPYPATTFSGALFYLSVAPHTSEAECLPQPSPAAKPDSTTVGGENFTHSYDEQGTICTEARRETYTALRHGSCYRFDLVIHTFCGEEVSGMRTIRPAQLEDIRRRLQSILSSVSFERK